jgi:hypothetical protein
MKNYQHTQPARTIVIVLSAIGLVFTVGGIFCYQLILGTLALFIVGYFFRSMTIKISDSELTWHFGSGFERKTVSMGEVISAEVVRRVWNRWGIHYTPQGWLYNVSGTGAVCVTLRNGKRFYLGTDEPEVLAGRLAEQLGNEL